MPLNCGIIGLPNVGKSTIFSALSAVPVEAANYPFCTIEPNVGLVAVPDSRIDKIAELIPSQKLIPAIVEFVDIAGLVKGASKGEGLGNQFLSHIREVGIIIHVIRCFTDDDIVHVNNRIDPSIDIETINMELALADLETVERRMTRVDKELRSADKANRARAEVLMPVLENLRSLLQEGQSAQLLQLDDEKALLIRDLHLITRKKMLYLCNVDEKGLSEDNVHVQKVREIAAAEGAGVLTICGQLEKEISALKHKEEQAEFLMDAGLTQSGLVNLIREGYKLLDLRTFFTAGEKEIRAWTFRNGSKAPHTAGIIHSDFEKGFIKAEVYHCEDLFELGSEQRIKEAGRLRVVGRDYTVQDGDVMYFKFR